VIRQKIELVTETTNLHSGPANLLLTIAARHQ
jgi:hypothetical protein